VSDESFGERLRRLRESKGFSISDLASAVGVSESTIRQIEVGNVKSPSFALGLRISDRLAVDPYYLALGEGFSISERLNLIEGRIMKLEQRVAAIPAPRR
jgi:transcriptional regulator with XRE-family HTH domain